MSNFDALWALKPADKSYVYVYDKVAKVHNKKQIYRSFKSYLKVPPFDKLLPKSYMYDGVEPSTPGVLEPYIKSAQAVDPRYNSLILNFYEPSDFIQPHRDCDHYMVDDYTIRIISLNEFADSSRSMFFYHLDGRFFNKVPLLDGPSCHVTLDKFSNTNYRHCVPMGTGKRISLTFRMLV